MTRTGVSTLLVAFAALASTTNAGLLAPPSKSASSSVPNASVSSAVASSSPAPTSSPTDTNPSTAVPSNTASPDQPLPSQVPLAPKQAWCPSEIFCAGALLQTVNVAQIYPDSKTFVDKPTTGTSNKTLSDFYAFFGQPNANLTTNATYGQLENYVQVDFKGEGLELEALTLDQNANPKFLSGVSDPLVKAWSGVINGYWGQLARGTKTSTLCDGKACESSLIPLNHTFVVPGGRFREQYYWDSFWIVEGLIRSELYGVINSTLQNFMDELEHIGFIPNGGRIYYLNRSQPPLFMKMLSAYVKASNDTSILARALPLAEKELDWWTTNRTISLKSPYTKTTYKVAHYAVVNTAPRPEGYLPDYLAANGPDITTPYTEKEKEALYAELASGAESGWDYSTRWIKQPYAGNLTDSNPKLRTLNVRSTIPVDLNSILYNYRILLAELYDIQKSHSKRAPSPSSQGRAAHHRSVAATQKRAILDLFWDSKRLAFYDFNMTSNARGTIFTAAHFYPFWNDVIPDEVAKDEEKAFSAMSSLNLVMRRYNGTFPTTFIESGLQWDYPNTWPPHQYIALQALLHLPSKVKTQPLPPVSASRTSFSYIPANQLGLTAAQLPAQPLSGGQTTTADINAIGSGTVTNGGNATSHENWASALGRELANRYMASAFCSWYATGGSIQGVLQQLSPEELNATHSDPSSTGHMFEKFNAADIDIAGSGGEYTVQAGFGWTNGVVLWAADTYGQVLAKPNCPKIDISQSTSSIFVGKRKRGM